MFGSLRRACNLIAVTGDVGQASDIVGWGGVLSCLYTNPGTDGVSEPHSIKRPSHVLPVSEYCVVAVLSLSIVLSLS